MNWLTINYSLRGNLTKKSIDFVDTRTLTRIIMYGRGAAQGGNNVPNFAKMLENCENFDNDIRFTGANDLCNEITKATEQIEESLERRICAAFIKQLDDTNMEVKSNAVKCIQRITPKIRENHLTTIVNKLITDIASASKPEALDILSLTVRGIVTDCRESYAPTLISTVAPHLLRGVESVGSPQV